MEDYTVTKNTPIDNDYYTFTYNKVVKDITNKDVTIVDRKEEITLTNLQDQLTQAQARVTEIEAKINAIKALVV